MAKENGKKQSIFQFLKFVMFSASAGVIEIASFTVMEAFVVKMPFIQNAMASNETFAKIMQNEYGPVYLIALLLSVLWNFTFNRKFTFKSAANVPVAMLKVLAFYAVFTPVSTILGHYATTRFAAVGGIDYIVLACTMLTNFLTEFFYDKFIVFKDTAKKDGSD